MYKTYGYGRTGVVLRSMVEGLGRNAVAGLRAFLRPR